jgi:hypothetical protein
MQDTIGFVRLFLRPTERLFADCVLIGARPSTFARESIHLGDSTNFVRATRFFAAAISAAFLFEIASLYALGVGKLNEPYYWLFILLTSIPFVLICFVLLRPVARVPFKDVLHVSLYAIGAGVFAGAGLSPVVSGTIALLVAIGYIPDVRIDFSQWDERTAVVHRALTECLERERGVIFTALIMGLGEEYSAVKAPIGGPLSYVRTVVTLLFLLVAARLFMAVAKAHKWVVFSLVLLSAALATTANYWGLRTYLDWDLENTACAKQDVVELTADALALSSIQDIAKQLDASEPDTWYWDASVTAEGRTLLAKYRWTVLVGRKPESAATRRTAVNVAKLSQMLMGTSRDGSESRADKPVAQADAPSVSCGDRRG